MAVDCPLSMPSTVLHPLSGTGSTDIDADGAHARVHTQSGPRGPKGCLFLLELVVSLLFAYSWSGYPYPPPTLYTIPAPLVVSTKSRMSDGGRVNMCHPWIASVCLASCNLTVNRPAISIYLFLSPFTAWCERHASSYFPEDALLAGSLWFGLQIIANSLLLRDRKRVNHLL